MWTRSRLAEDLRQSVFDLIADYVLHLARFVVDFGQIELEDIGQQALGQPKAPDDPGGLGPPGRGETIAFLASAGDVPCCAKRRSVSDADGADTPINSATFETVAGDAVCNTV
ncbi:MAG TPA: hypothetical protein VGK88_02745 [bacterium]